MAKYIAVYDGEGYDDRWVLLNSEEDRYIWIADHLGSLSRWTIYERGREFKIGSR